MPWLRRSFIAGFFVTVPLIISVAALVWIFGIIDRFTARRARLLDGLCQLGIVRRCCSCLRSAVAQLHEPRAARGDTWLRACRVPDEYAP